MPVDAAIQAHAAGQIAHCFYDDDVILCVANGGGAAVFAGELQLLLKAVYLGDFARAQHVRAGNGAEAHRAVALDHDCLGGLVLPVKLNALASRFFRVDRHTAAYWAY